jgi:pimeloyl-ACP methyl ester carboxylesterase
MAVFRRRIAERERGCVVPYLKTPRGDFFYQEMGPPAGQVVYLLHGLTAQCQDWEMIPAELAKAGFHSYAFDMRGHGHSEKPATGYSPEDLARDLEVCSTVMNHHKVHLVGHSTGGRNALFFATMFPQKTQTLTIIDQTLTADPQSWERQKETYAEYPTPFPSAEALDEFLMAKFPDRERRRHYERTQFHQGPDGSWDWSFSVPAVLEIQKLGRAKELHWLLKRVKCPILFMKAERSDYVTPEEAEKIQEVMPDGKLVTIENAGHGLFRDNPQAFLATLVPFLKSLP